MTVAPFHVINAPDMNEVAVKNPPGAREEKAPQKKEPEPAESEK